MQIPINKATSFVTIILGFLGFLFSILCLFAGTSPGFVPNGEIIQLNISQLGKTNIFGTADLTACRRDVVLEERQFGAIADFANNAVDTVRNGVECGIGQAQNGLNQIQSQIADRIAGALNLPDFFDFHVMNFCQGNFDPADYVARGIRDPRKDIRECSPKLTEIRISFSQILQDRVLTPAGLTLQDIRFPDAIIAAENGLNAAVRVMVIAYAAGVGFAGMSALLGVAGIFVVNKILGLATLAMSALAFLFLMSASAGATAIMVKAVPVINNVGGLIGIAATRGNIFLGLTWTATILMFLATAVSAAAIVLAKKLSGGFGGEKDEEYYSDDDE